MKTKRRKLRLTNYIIVVTMFISAFSGIIMPLERVEAETYLNPYTVAEDISGTISINPGVAYAGLDISASWSGTPSSGVVFECFINSGTNGSWVKVQSLISPAVGGRRIPTNVSWAGYTLACKVTSPNYNGEIWAYCNLQAPTQTTSVMTLSAPDGWGGGHNYELSYTGAETESNITMETAQYWVYVTKDKNNPWNEFEQIMGANVGMDTPPRNIWISSEYDGWYVFVEWEPEQIGGVYTPGGRSDFYYLGSIGLYEPNNTKDTATTGRNNWRTEATIHNNTDVDWYKYENKANGKRTFILDNIPSGCDYDMQIVNADTNVDYSNTQSGSTSEVVVVDNLPKGTYYIKISSVYGSSDISKYRLYFGDYYYIDSVCIDGELFGFGSIHKESPKRVISLTNKTTIPNDAVLEEINMQSQTTGTCIGLTLHVNSSSLGIISKPGKSITMYYRPSTVSFENGIKAKQDYQYWTTVTSCNNFSLQPFIQIAYSFPVTTSNIGYVREK